MKVETRIDGMNEGQVHVVSEVLTESMGFEYDEDFTTLYGAGWAVIGLVLYGEQERRVSMENVINDVMRELTS